MDSLHSTIGSTSDYSCRDMKRLFAFHSVMDQAIAGGTPEEKCLVIDNAIDNEQFSRRRPISIAKQQDFPESENRLLIGSIGRLSAEKGFDLLVNAFSKLINDGLDAELVIAGGGTRKGESAATNR